MNLFKNAFSAAAKFIAPVLIFASCAAQKYDQQGVSQVKDPTPKEVEALINNPAFQFYQVSDHILRTPNIQFEDESERSFYALTGKNSQDITFVAEDKKAKTKMQAFNEGITTVIDGRIKGTKKFISDDSLQKLNELTTNYSLSDGTKVKSKPYNGPQITKGTR